MKKRWGRALLFCAQTIVTDLGNVDLARLKKEERKTIARFASTLCGTFVTVFATQGVLLVMKTLKDEWYAVTKLIHVGVPFLRFGDISFAYLTRGATTLLVGANCGSTS